MMRHDKEAGGKMKIFMKERNSYYIRNIKNRKGIFKERNEGYHFVRHEKRRNIRKRSKPKTLLYSMNYFGRTGAMQINGVSGRQMVEWFS